MSSLLAKDVDISITITEKSKTVHAPRVLKFKATMNLEDPSIATVADVKIMSCGGVFVDKALCIIQSSYNFIKNLAHGEFKNELLRRVKSIDFSNTQIKFNSVRLNSIEFDNETKIERVLVDYAVEIINQMSEKNGFIHKYIETAVSSMSQKVANTVILSHSSSFQSACV
jgi:hypothetical protein